MAHPDGCRGFAVQGRWISVFPTPTVMAIATHQVSVGEFPKLLPEARNNPFQQERAVLAVVSFPG